jgi:hypothetical protein
VDYAWYEWVICVETAVILGLLPHVLWPGHKSPLPFTAGDVAGHVRRAVGARVAKLVGTCRRNTRRAARPALSRE